MGFGNGYSSRSDHGGKRYNNSQVAHVWNAQTKRDGQSNNGNFYFRGRAIYSYGSHYLAGFIMPDGVALLNGKSYSVSTSGHMSDVRGAVRNRATFSFSDLTELESLLEAIARGKLDSVWKASARRIIRTHAGALASSKRCEAGRYWDNESDGRESLGEYLTRLAGLPAASWPKLQREAAAAKAKAERETAKASRARIKADAIALADMSDSEFRRALTISDSSWDCDARHKLQQVATRLFNAVRTAKAEQLSDKRRAKLSARRKAAYAKLSDFDRLFAIVNRSVDTRRAIARIREYESSFRALIEAGQLPDYRELSNGRYVAESLAWLRDNKGRRLSEATRNRLGWSRTRLMTALERLEAERLEREAAERAERERLRHLELAERERLRHLELAEYRELWLAGNAPLGGRYFDAPSGGAALRIKGNRLETSHGAEVPLAEAVRAFRFIKLCREAGREWQANGQQVRVGAFHLDWIDSAGNMKAGCHSFTWPEIQRAAELAGVAGDAPSAEAVRKSQAA